MKENIWVYRRINLILDLGLTGLAYLLASWTRFWLHPWFPAFYLPDYQILFYIIPIWTLVLALSPQMYEYRMVSLARSFKNVSLAWSKCLGALLAVLFFTRQLDPSRAALIIFAIYDLFLLFFSRRVLGAILAFFRRRGHNQHKVLLVGTGQMARDFINKAKAHPEWGWRFVGILEWDYSKIGSQLEGVEVRDTLDQLPRILQNEHVDYVVYAVPRRFLQALEDSIAACEEMGVKVYVLADFFNLKIARKQFRFLFNQPALFYSTGPGRDGSLFIKYAVDKIMAATILLLVSPLMLAASLLVKLASPGPILFRQTRTGLNGKKFTMYKYRTMVEDADKLKDQLLSQNEMSGPVFKISDDPRLTRVGKLLRKTSVDELPQLFNVLSGDMSLVGPRPPLPEEVAHYNRWQRRKLSIKPGITCLWQVNGRNKIDFEHWMRLDLHYIDNWSLWLDAKILLKTVPAVFTGLGAK